tara:strand:- start:31 stop:2178 length:2148 start_codon:yes stop_codon:yes gene_type:complete
MLSTEGISTPTFEDDFSTYADTTAGDLAYPTNDTSRMRVNPTTDVFDFTSTRNGSPATSYHDLTSVSDTAWVLRFRYNMTSNTSDARLFVGLSSTTGNYGATEDWLGIIIPNTAHTLWSITDYNNAPVTIGSYSSFALTPVASTDYFVELIRLSSTSFKLNLYSDSAYSVLINSVTHTMLATVDGLSYLKIMNMNNDSAGYTMTGIIDDIKFYNGITSVVSTVQRPTNVQDNSILVEKDTAKRYWFAGAPTAPTTTSNFPSGNNTSGSVNTRVDIPLTDISVSNGSVSFWVYRPSSGASADNQYVAFSVSNDTQASTEFFVGVYGNSNTVKLMSRNNGSWLVSATAGTVPTGAWSHIVYTNNTSTGNKIYVNGAVTSPSYAQGSASSDVFTDNISFNTSTIGASKDSSNGYEWGMIGNLQQLLIYDKTLSQADVTALYNGGKYGTPSTTNLLRKYELTSDANDTSGNGHNGTVAGSLTYTSLAIPQGTGTWTYEYALPTISGLKLHLDADDASTITTATGVSQWSDKSGQGNHLTQATGSKQPLVQSAALNGKNTILMDGTADKLQRTTYTGGAISQAVTFYLVVKVSQTVGDSGYIFDAGGATRNYCYNNGTAPDLYYMNGGGSDIIPSTNVSTTWTMISLVFDGASSSFEQDQVVIATGNSGTSATNGITLGGRHTDSSYAAHDYAEVLVYDSVLSAVDKSGVEIYLKNKWGI